MRLWMALTSAPETMGTPFLRVTPTFPGALLPGMFAPECAEFKLLVSYRLIPQIMAVDAEQAKFAVDTFSMDVPFVELNCGCPSPTPVGKGAGSSLLQNPEYFFSTVSSLASSVGPGRLAIKMRTGFYDEREFPNLLSGLSSLPLARLTIHGRTRVDGYTGKARWNWMSMAATQCSFPVIGSGDVVDAASLQQKRLEAPEISGVIVGRGALRNPWIFQELTGLSRNIELSLNTLCHALIVHCLLHEWTRRETETTSNIFDMPSGIARFMESGRFLKAAINDESRWMYHHQKLRQVLRLQTLDERHPYLGLDIKGPALGRTKMLWNYLKSSLPDAFSEPLLLRSADLEQLISGILAIGQAQGLGRGIFLNHNPRWDRIYSGRAANP